MDLIETKKRSATNKQMLDQIKKRTEEDLNWNNCAKQVILIVVQNVTLKTIFMIIYHTCLLENWILRQEVVL